MKKYQYNFPEELLYENIVKSMGERKNFIPNTSIFPHGKIEGNIEFAKENLVCTGKQYSDEELQKYIATLPKTFEDWLK